MRIARVLIFFLSVTILSAAKTPITHEALWLMKRVGTPSPSPDGKWVVFSVTEPAYDDKDVVSDLWLVPADGSAKPRRITATKAPEAGVAWSPDSAQIAFSTRREGDDANQIYVLNLAQGGEARRVTSLSTGAGSPRWRPDGKALLFVSSVFPGAADDDANRRIAAEQKARKYNARVFDSFPVRAWDRWVDEKQTHVLVQSLEPSAKAMDLLAGTKLVAEKGYAAPPGSISGDDPGAIWTPDGSAVVFSATTIRSKAAYATVNHHLYVVPANGGEPKQITSGPDNYAKPAFRPDGKALYCIQNKRGETYSLDRLAMFDWPAAGERHMVAGEFDRSVGNFGFTPDSSRIYFLAEDSGHDKLMSVPARGGKVDLAFEMAVGSYSGLALAESAPEPRLFASFDSTMNPAEIVRIDPAAKTHRLLSDFNVDRAEALDLPAPREFWFTSKLGRKIHNMAILPPDFSEQKKYPLFVVIHGGPHSEWKDQFVLRWNYHMMAAPGYVVLLTNYTGSTGFGEKFTQNIEGDPLKTPGDEINEAADEAIKRFPFVDAARQAAGGASYGGHLANWLQASTTRYKCLISHAGLVNLESQWGTSDTIYGREVTNGGPVWEQGKVWREQNPIRYAAKFKTPILITVGEHDFRVPINNSLENWSVLQRLQIPSRLIVFPDANHWILKGEDSRFFYSEVQAWLKKWL